MGLLDRIRTELIDIIEWIDDSQHTLVWRFPRYQNEIKSGAELIVRPGQVAVFVDRGELADVFYPGHYQLQTDNLPILSTLKGWKHGFNSPFRSEVYFVSTRQVPDLKWGTPNPVIVADPDYGPVRLRAFGVYSLRALDAATLLKELVSTQGQFEADEVTELVRSIIASTFAQMLAEAKLTLTELAANHRRLGDELQTRVNEQIDDEYGLAVPLIKVVNISLPPQVESALDVRTRMALIGDPARYQQFQLAEALPTAAANPGGGLAAAGMGLGMGLAVAGPMAQTMAPTGAPVPPLPTLWHIAKDGKSLGPYGLPQLARAVAAGEISADTLVWSAGMQGWTPAREVPAIAALFGPPPPPPPPPKT